MLLGIRVIYYIREKLKSKNYYNFIDRLIWKQYTNNMRNENSFKILYDFLYAEFYLCSFPMCYEYLWKIFWRKFLS